LVSRTKLAAFFPFFPFFRVIFRRRRLHFLGKNAGVFSTRSCGALGNSQGAARLLWKKLAVVFSIGDGLDRGKNSALKRGNVSPFCARGEHCVACVTFAGSGCQRAMRSGSTILAECAANFSKKLLAN
jgi:hypothetical protein